MWTRSRSIPIRDRKIVIQAERYTNTDGVAAVRYLFGTVHIERATKGNLVTTSDYGPDANEFAQGKPLTLLSAGEFLYLIQSDGYRAKIDIKEAKEVLGGPNAPIARLVAEQSDKRHQVLQRARATTTDCRL